jgi:hypothetical protein
LQQRSAAADQQACAPQGAPDVAGAAGPRLDVVHPLRGARIAGQHDDARGRIPGAKSRQQSREHRLVAEIAETVVAAD